MRLTDKVPGTKYTAEQICRCKVVESGTEIKPGQVLAYVGAYDNKYVVQSITYLGQGPNQWGSGIYDIYAVAVRYLGKFFADNRVRPASKRRSVVKEIRVYQSVGSTRITRLGNLRPVVPVGDVKPVKEPKLVYSTEMEVSLSEAALLDSAASLGKAPLPLNPPKPLPPEVVLASFRIQ